MYIEDVVLRAGESVAAVIVAYGYRAAAIDTVWGHPSNAALAARRGAPASAIAGDVLQVPIPWKLVSESLAVEARGVGYAARRDGELGQRLSWTQTVYQDNQPAPSTTPYCVDACPADDNLPFYYTAAELAAIPRRRKTFEDHPARSPPPAATRPTRWRAVLSIAVITGKRVTVYNSRVWGFNMTPAGVVTAIGPRTATAAEATGHVGLLRTGRGTAASSFGAQGWIFRSAA
jgi:hypothetical protein